MGRGTTIVQVAFSDHESILIGISPNIYIYICIHHTWKHQWELGGNMLRTGWELTIWNKLGTCFCFFGFFGVYVGNVVGKD